ncbi:MAG: response regulator, partial [Thermodesulfobacteriota bacterium]
NEELEEQTQTLSDQKEHIQKKNLELVKAQSAINQKARELEVASRYKSEFLANMSHELRTPLNSILILSQLLSGNRDENLTSKQVEAAKAINTSGAELLKLINDILDLSKVEAGKIELQVTQNNMGDFLADLRRVFREQAEEKGLDFVIERLEGSPETIRTDSHRLQQVLRNLLSNAFKFTAEGTVTVRVRRPEPEEVELTGLDPATSVAFSVIDQGIGIPADKQALIFEAFKQADGSTSRTYGGTGLGLSISRELTKLLGGVIRLKSAIGEGSEFTVILPEEYAGPAGESVTAAKRAGGEAAVEGAPAPAAEQAPATPIPTPPAEPARAEAAPPASPPPPAAVEDVKDDRKSLAPGDKTLLVIEDDPRFCEVLRDLAHERGFKCLVAGDGETGLHFADYHRPNAIILDIGLPGIDGWTVMERLKANPDTRHIPVHFMSASDSSLDAMRMGAVGFLTKPVSLEKIDEAMSRIEKILSRSMSRLLVVEDDDIQRESIRSLIGNGDVKTTAVRTGAEALDELSTDQYDCMILDLGLEDMSGFDLLERIRSGKNLPRVPIIIYTGRDITREEEAQLARYAESIIIKGARSPERLVEETALFLHRVESSMPQEKQRRLKLVHDKDAILSGRRILLVDDDMRNVFALTSVLEEKGINPIIARNGLECLEKLKENPDTDLILMDIMMPKMDGYEAMRAIRKDPRHKKLPIIALTAKAMAGDRAKCIDAGASDYLAKPVNTDKLISMLRVWLYK